MHIEMPKTKVIEILNENKEEFTFVYKTLSEEYEKKVDAAVEDAVEKVKKHRDRINRYSLDLYNLRKPNNHTEDYNLAVDMLASCSNDTITLSPDDFKKFIKNKWEWTSEYGTYALSASYATTGSRAYTILNKYANT